MEQVLTPHSIRVPAGPAPQKKSFRFESIDVLRGLIMIIMALDHTRDFFHIKANTEDPLNLATTTPILFFTRWITHFCAPIFVFLAGSSAWFQSLRKSKKELSLFLIKRGLWLIFMEVVIVNLFYTFDFHYGVIGLQTIWSIGISMVILGLAILLPFPVILSLGLIIVLQHNVLDFYEAQHKGPISFVYDLMHRFNIYQLDKTHYLLILYPFLPWTGLMLLGYCFGKLFTTYEGAERKKVLLWTGIGVIAYFILIRAFNIYGNPEQWHVQKNFLFTVLSFIDTHKYPPSLLYMCMTIGPAIIFLALIKNTKSRLSQFISVYGRVPFFYYLAHFLLLHLLSTVVFFARGHSYAEGIHTPPDLTANFLLPGEGFSLGVVYLIWIAVILSLYPLCKWYDRYKSSHREKWWLSYL
jgi:uncharacterized membrane protein